MPVVVKASEDTGGLSWRVWTLHNKHRDRVSRSAAGHRNTGGTMGKGLHTFVFEGEMLLNRKSLSSGRAGVGHGGHGRRKCPDLRRGAFSFAGFALLGVPRGPPLLIRTGPGCRGLPRSAHVPSLGAYHLRTRSCCRMCLSPGRCTSPSSLAMEELAVGVVRDWSWLPSSHLFRHQAWEVSTCRFPLGAT